MKAALLAGTQSGCGKTTVMLALLQYFKQHKRSITAFKAGPDFLDPLWHQAITGMPSYNLDTQMVGVEECKIQLSKQDTVEFALIEGVMGLFDGRAGVGREGSCADLAKHLDVPVILVVDVKGMSGTVVAVVSGFCQYAVKTGIEIVGVIANRVGSSYHAELISGFLIEHQLPPLIAWLEKKSPVIAERHLGLVRPQEAIIPELNNFLHVNNTDLLQVFHSVNNQECKTRQASYGLSGKKIAIARDAACCFIYPANLDWLQAQGAKLTFFSPIADQSVPDNADAVWLPGGYPELYTASLSSQTNWKTSIREHITQGKPVLAECGGMMLLGKELIDQKGQVWRMAEVLDFVCRMQNKLASLGYREDASGVRGHEFHHSKRDQDQDLAAAFNVLRGDAGMRYKKLRASYIHWYFPSAPQQILEWLL